MIFPYQTLKRHFARGVEPSEQVEFQVVVQKRTRIRKTKVEKKKRKLAALMSCRGTMSSRCADENLAKKNRVEKKKRKLGALMLPRGTISSRGAEENPAKANRLEMKRKKLGALMPPREDGKSSWCQGGERRNGKACEGEVKRREIKLLEPSRACQVYSKRQTFSTILRVISTKLKTSSATNAVL